uniref:Uncharacterized protein n=1 Tax=Vannella robusta TaxID=1487602 RepID=A0A7S4IRN6_9EUKA|mmetsp:Transcript_75/g.103  ORF Transcript_75/g.103 Transcript_75/m.103 type:complete len:793 (+) Transcript_75:324-2702(+)
MTPRFVLRRAHVKKKTCILRHPKEPGTTLKLSQTNRITLPCQVSRACVLFIANKHKLMAKGVSFACKTSTTKNETTIIVSGPKQENITARLNKAIDEGFFKTVKADPKNESYLQELEEKQFLFKNRTDDTNLHIFFTDKKHEKTIERRLTESVKQENSNSTLLREQQVSFTVPKVVWDHWATKNSSMIIQWFTMGELLAPTVSQDDLRFSVPKDSPIYQKMHEWAECYAYQSYPIKLNKKMKVIFNSPASLKDKLNLPDSCIIKWSPAPVGCLYIISDISREELDELLQEQFTASYLASLVHGKTAHIKISRENVSWWARYGSKALNMPLSVGQMNNAWYVRIAASPNLFLSTIQTASAENEKLQRYVCNELPNVQNAISSTRPCFIASLLAPINQIARSNGCSVDYNSRTKQLVVVGMQNELDSCVTELSSLSLENGKEFEQDMKLSKSVTVELHIKNVVACFGLKHATSYWEELLQKQFPNVFIESEVVKKISNKFGKQHKICLVVTTFNNEPVATFCENHANKLNEGTKAMTLIVTEGEADYLQHNKGFKDLPDQTGVWTDISLPYDRKFYNFDGKSSTGCTIQVLRRDLSNLKNRNGWKQLKILQLFTQLQQDSASISEFIVKKVLTNNKVMVLCDCSNSKADAFLMDFVRALVTEINDSSHPISTLRFVDAKPTRIVEVCVLLNQLLGPHTLTNSDENPLQSASKVKVDLSYVEDLDGMDPHGAKSKIETLLKEIPSVDLPFSEHLLSIVCSHPVDFKVNEDRSTITIQGWQHNLGVLEQMQKDNPE